MLRRSKNLFLPLACAAVWAASIPGPASYALAEQTMSPALPDTAAGRQLGEFLDAFNRRDEAALAAINARFSGPVPPVAMQLSVRERSGGFDLRKIEESTETSLSAVLEGRRTEQFVRITVQLDDTPDHRIVSMPVNPIDRPPEFALQPPGDAEFARQMDEQLQTLAAEDRFSGAAMVVHGDKVMFAGAAGYADRENKVPVTLDTKFRYGSMGKMFTGVAVMQLVQAGRVSLSAPLGKFLPDYPNKAVAKVTIEQLLTHTGGTGDIFAPEYMEHRKELLGPADYVKIYGERPLRFDPGSKWEYSNYGFVLLGRVIEVASGEDYYSYVQRHVFAPAGMSSSGFWTESEQVAGRAKGYTPTPEGVRPAADTAPPRGSPAGGGISTVGDFVKFAQALRDHTLLDAEHTALLTTGRIETPNGPDAKYAFGFSENAAGTPRHRFGHSGGADGQSGQLDIYPEAGYVVVALSNFDQVARLPVNWAENRLAFPR